jgi:tight adherence protein C
MTRAELLAAAAGALAAPALVELVPAAAAALVPAASGRSVLERLGRGFGWRAPRGLEARIAAAGLDRPVADVMAVKVGAALAALAVAVAFLPLAPGRLGLLLVVAAPAAGFLAPDAALTRRTRRRTRAIEAELADVLDLLRVAVAAGLSPGRALAEVGRRHPGVLARELARAAAHAALGVPRQESYAQLERRAPAAGIPALVAALQRADRHGAPLARTLAAEARTARARNAQRAAEHAARAAPQIQLVVALLLVPAVLLLVAAALLPAIVPT